MDLIWGDAMRVDLAALEPTPTAFVANLPYNVAAPLILRSIDALPNVRTWCCLVQREVADRFLAGAGEAAYGAPSVLCALALEPVGRPRGLPLGLRSRAERRLVARRLPARRALAGARRTLAGDPRGRLGRVRPPPQDGRELARAGGLGVATRGERLCAVAGIDPRARAEALEPEAFVALAAALRRVKALAPAKVNLLLRRRAAARDGYHELASLIRRSTSATRRARGRGATTVAGFPAATRSCARARPARRASGSRRLRRAARQAPPGRGRAGGRERRRGRRPRLANRLVATPLEAPALLALAATVGSDVPFFLVDGPQLGSGDGTTLEPVDLPQDFWIVLRRPEGRAEAVDRRRLRRLRRRDGGAGWDERRAALLAALAAVRRPRDLAALPPNDLAGSPLTDELRGLGAFHADVSRRRPRGVRALPSPGARGGRKASAEAGRGELADGTCVVRLTHGLGHVECARARHDEVRPAGSAHAERASRYGSRSSRGSSSPSCTISPAGRSIVHRDSADPALRILGRNATPTRRAKSPGSRDVRRRSPSLRPPGSSSRLCRDRLRRLFAIIAVAFFFIRPPLDCDPLVGRGQAVRQRVLVP